GGTILSAAIFEGSGTPWLSPAELGAMGFRHVSFPVTVLFRAVAAMRRALADLRRHAEGRGAFEPLAEGSEVRAALDEAVGLARWRAIEASVAGEVRE